MSGPLAGIQVVDCGQWVQGAFLGAMLGDLGAEVVKVEDRVGGDPCREMVRILAGQTYQVRPDFPNFIFEFCNRNKRGIALDLSKERGREIIYKLVARADVLLHNWRVGTAERIGLDYETLSQYNPCLIYAQASGWGAEGPLRADAAWEMTAMARTGMLDLVREPGADPVIFPSGLGDQIGATMTAVGILAALQARQRLGTGQKVDVSLMGSLMSIMGCQFHSWLIAGFEYPKRARATMRNPLWSYYQCADNRWICLNMAESDRYWPTLCQAMGIKHLVNDPRFANAEARTGNNVELIHILEEVFATKPVAEWLKLFAEQGPGELIYAPIQSVPEACADSQALTNKYIMDFDHPTLGATKMVGFPYQFSQTPATLRREAPKLGQHTEEVLTELGYSREDISRLKDDEVI